MSTNDAILAGMIRRQRAREARRADKLDGQLMACLARWRNTDRVAHAFERAYAGLHASEIAH